MPSFARATIAPLVRVTALATLAACGGDPPEADAPRVRSAREAIVGGVPAADHPEAALLDVYDDAGRRTTICSGALVAPRVVLTAAHCLALASEIRVTFPHAARRTAKARAHACYDCDGRAAPSVTPNQHDIALAFLDTPVEISAYPAIAGARVPDGTRAVNVGRVRDGRASDAELFVGREVTLEDGADVGYPFAYASRGVIERGDSGGPVVVATRAGHTIVAVGSGASGGTQILARTDLVAGWILERIAAWGPGAGGADADAGADAGAEPGADASTDAGDGAEAGTDTEAAVDAGFATDAGGDDDAGAPCAPRREPPRNDVPWRADALFGTRCGALGPARAVDWYTWSADAGGVDYRVTLATAGDARLALVRHAPGLTPRVELATGLTVAGTTRGAERYLLAVFSPGGAPQRYAVRLGH